MHRPPTATTPIAAVNDPHHCSPAAHAAACMLSTNITTGRNTNGALNAWPDTNTSSMAQPQQCSTANGTCTHTHPCASHGIHKPHRAHGRSTAAIMQTLALLHLQAHTSAPNDHQQTNSSSTAQHPGPINPAMQLMHTWPATLMHCTCPLQPDQHSNRPAAADPCLPLAESLVHCLSSHGLTNSIPESCTHGAVR